MVRERVMRGQRAAGTCEERRRRKAFSLPDRSVTERSGLSAPHCVARNDCLGLFPPIAWVPIDERPEHAAHTGGSGNTDAEVYEGLR